MSDEVASSESDPRNAQFWQDTAAHVRQEGGQWLTAKQIAVAAGIAESAGRDLVRKLKLASVGRDQATGAKLYDADQARTALADKTLRPGQGRRTDLKETTMTMLADKGADFAVKWPWAIAGKLGVSPEYIAIAYERVTGKKMNKLAFYASRETHTPVQEISDLTQDEAKAIIAEMHTIVTELKKADETQCHHCGLDLNSDGECWECGPQTVGEFF